MPESRREHRAGPVGGPTTARTHSSDRLEQQLAELRDALTSVTLELEHLRHRVEVLEHNASVRE